MKNAAEHTTHGTDTVTVKGANNMIYRNDSPEALNALERQRLGEDSTESVPRCDNCGHRIHDRYYWDFNGEIFCMTCVRETDPEDLAEILGYEKVYTGV